MRTKTLHRRVNTSKSAKKCKQFEIWHNFERKKRKMSQALLILVMTEQSRCHLHFSIVSCAFSFEYSTDGLRREFIRNFPIKFTVFSVRSLVGLFSLTFLIFRKTISQCFVAFLSALKSFKKTHKLERDVAYSASCCSLR